MVDKSVLRNKINFINESLNKLNSLRQLNKDEFLNSFQAVDSSKYNLQVAIEAIIDIASHIIAREKMGVPATSADAVKLLSEHGLFNEQQTLRTIQMIKFRNRIVHLYQEVNNEQVYEILQTGLSDIQEFIDQIEKNVLQ
ncbi:type VII toxin-antitoxin system HepT family RNase toxin [Desulfitobacterium sp. AusDCA]|uniref:type VII toxin-antitoxin system HepT family RNase toxin n=1 Tax=Desulfitobacterium sp. AusDCA TaxID=3240383 RepID=UPI003DA774C6